MRLLLTEDDSAIARSVAQFLRQQGFAVDAVTSGEDALVQAERNTYDAILLDVQLPGIDGYAVCRQLRARGVRSRIVMATARDGVEDRITGLDLGADDYLVKPYALGELAARLRAVLRRPSELQPVVLHVGDLALDTGTRVVTRGARRAELTNKEFAVLEYLMRHAGEVVTRERIGASAWDDNFDPASNVIDVFIARLRRKIDHEGETPLLSTIRGAGYRLGPAPAGRPR